MRQRYLSLAQRHESYKRIPLKGKGIGYLKAGVDSGMSGRKSSVLTHSVNNVNNIKNIKNINSVDGVNGGDTVNSVRNFNSKIFLRYFEIFLRYF